MLSRSLAALAMGLMLQGCQPPTYDIIAIVRGADLVFEARGSGSWPFRDDDGISANWVAVRDGTRLLWAIQLDPDRPDCQPRGATPPFPLVYGRLPRCYREMAPAASLRDGALNRIDGEGFRSGSGLFTLDRAATNVEREAVQAEVQGWPVLPDPRFPAGVGNGGDGADAPEQGDLRNATRSDQD